MTTVQGLVVAAAAAFALNALLAPVLGIGFWDSDRGTRRLEARLAAPASRSLQDRPSAPARPPEFRHDGAPA